MQLTPALSVGWLNGWLPFGILVAVEGLLILAFPRAVVRRLFDRSRWKPRQAALTAAGKVFSLLCIVLLVCTPLKFGTWFFWVGVVLYLVGLGALVVSLLTFRKAPEDRPATSGIYRLSRHPQLVALFIAFSGMCLAVGSWPALVALIISRAMQHPGILAEEEACLAAYGQAYRRYCDEVPRYLLIA